MRNPFLSVADIFHSGLHEKLSAWAGQKAGTNRVLKSTRLEDRIYADLRAGDKQMDGVEEKCSPKLSTFPDLSRDIYQSVYSLRVSPNEEEGLTDTARRFNKHILDTVIAGEDYPVLKAACEGRELPAYDAASEFTTQVADGLDTLMEQAGGDKNALNTLEKLEQQRNQLAQGIQALLVRREVSGASAPMDDAIIKKAGQFLGKASQAENIGRMVEENLVKNREAITSVVMSAAHAAAQKAEETSDALMAWGNNPGDPKEAQDGRELLNQLRGNTALTEITRQLGRMREIVSATRKNGYAYGRGEKYDVELGHAVGRLLSSEYALLALPETAPLFFQKYQQKRLKQYRRREPIKKGQGDIIFCLDESASTAGKNAAWGKALALTMLEIAAHGGRKFALQRFAEAGCCEESLFLPGQYHRDDMLRVAEQFLNGGGTDYVTPLANALELIEHQGFERADIVFVTDGICDVPEIFSEQFSRRKKENHFTVTGVLLDQGNHFDFSLEPFCDSIYRTSELKDSKIAGQMIAKRA